MLVHLPIVGVRHYADPETLFPQLADAGCEEVIWLEAEDNNLYDPGRAVAAYFRGTKVGYVSSLTLPLLRPAMPESGRLDAYFAEANEEHTSFYVTVDLPSNEFPPYEPAFAMEPICGLSVPKRDVAYEQLCLQIEESLAIADGLEPAMALSVIENMLAPQVEQFLQSFGSSLSGDDMRLYLALTSAIQTPLVQLANQNLLDEYPHSVETARALFWALFEAYTSISSATDKLRSVYKKERQRAHKVFCAKGGFWPQLRTILTSQPHPLDAIEQEMAARRAWLQALPDNLGAFVNRPEFASRLFYRRFSSRELDLIYANLIILEECEKMLQDSQPSDSKKRLPAYWNPKSDRYQRRRAILELEQLIALPRGRYAAVAKWLVKWEHLGVIRPHLGGNRAEFCRDVEERFGIALDPSTLLKAIRN